MYSGYNYNTNCQTIKAISCWCYADAKIRICRICKFDHGSNSAGHWPSRAGFEEHCSSVCV